LLRIFLFFLVRETTGSHDVQPPPTVDDTRGSRRFRAHRSVRNVASWKRQRRDRSPAHIGLNQRISLDLFTFLAAPFRLFLSCCLYINRPCLNPPLHIRFPDTSPHPVPSPANLLQHLHRAVVRVPLAMGKSLIESIPLIALLRLCSASWSDRCLFSCFLLDLGPHAGKIKIGINGMCLSLYRSVVVFPRGEVWLTMWWFWVADFAQVSEGSEGSSPGSPSRATMSSSSPSTTPSSPLSTWYAPLDLWFSPVLMDRSGGSTRF
jgi:hypothetical protein